MANPSLIIVALALIGFSFVAIAADPQERRHHLGQLFIALLVGALFLPIAPAG